MSASLTTEAGLKDHYKAVRQRLMGTSQSAVVFAVEQAQEISALKGRVRHLSLANESLRAELAISREREMELRAQLEGRLRRFRAADALQLVASISGHTAEKIMSPRRDSHIIKARHLTMWLAHRFTGASYPTLGAFFQRDHSTIIHAVEKVSGIIRDKNLSPRADVPDAWARALWNVRWHRVEATVTVEEEARA